ncbi:Hypothetical predicted protein [Olea europaea subsp. europaea]|uniref:ENT domain-containing protein n=1 Tax=Olea europaea subsp. europaea TaxID=158383 RepID=A0A8S0STF2_OLEEU|nr:Hypothetical predicted protein [Olea europaea subsp. europaea]
MAFRDNDSSGTDDDHPQPQYNRVPVGGRVAVNGRSFVGSAPYQRMPTDMESEIHNLEQIAYAAVLQAFKAQSDALTWEKEGLITELRKELRVSDDEHRDLLTKVNADDLIRRIREWREAGGTPNAAFNVPQHVNDQLPSPAVSASRKKQKTSQSGNPFGMPSHSLHPQPATTQPSTSAGKWGPPLVMGGRRPYAGQQASTQRSMQYQINNLSSSGAPSTNDLAESNHDLLIGRRVMTRWPEDNNFYEAVITDYNPEDGRHSLVYDINTPNATLEWVHLKEIPQGDIRWVGNDPVISRLGEAGGQGTVVTIPSTGRGRVPSGNQFTTEILPSQNSALEDEGKFEILDTDKLIEKVEKVLDANHPDELEIEKAKKMLKEHERSLIEMIGKLADVCDSGNEDRALCVCVWVWGV